MKKKRIKVSLSESNIKLASEWHPTKNASLTPKDVTPGSSKKAWWICKKSHEWEATINGRSKGRSCPYCAGMRVTEENCLQSANPDLAREWHPAKNAPLTPIDVTPSSHKKAWWLCRQGHEWEAVINNRKRGTGCPYCAGMRVTEENCLQRANPRLAGEWHPHRNAPLTPRDIMPHSRRKVWWVCTKGHEWEAVLYHRSSGKGCPYCAGQKVDKTNCLRTVNPRLARQWHRSRNAPLTPTAVTAGSGRKVWWKCRKGHVWRAAVNNRSEGRGCPACAGKRPRKRRTYESRKNA